MGDSCEDDHAVASSEGTPDTADAHPWHGNAWHYACRLEFRPDAVRSSHYVPSRIGVRSYGRCSNLAMAAGVGGRHRALERDAQTSVRSWRVVLPQQRVVLRGHTQRKRRQCDTAYVIAAGRGVVRGQAALR